MSEILKNIFSSEHIGFFSPIPIKYCRVRRGELISRAGIEKPQTAIIFLIPYFSGLEEGNVSLYARSRDYHLYCRELFPRLCGALEAAFGGKFAGFADKSPIEETDAAAKCGLGVIGDSYVIINEKYGSFVFIGEIITDVAPEMLGCDETAEYAPKYCSHCGACRAACPMRTHGECLSAVTQKKGVLSAEETSYIREYGSAWGCDLCQLACPLVKKAISRGNVTPIEFFLRDRISVVTRESVAAMSEDDFRERAFSWRGRETLLRNLEILEK